ncbi:MAG: hypothetical protein U5K51_15580 [Flavobacteriaceae bacterium]|nr:hypothetical protein [Flavobacteriaceae bacterium]
MQDKNESGNYSVRAVTPDHQFMENTLIAKGRYINNLKDILIQNKRYAVIGRLVEKDIYKNTDAGRQIHQSNADLLIWLLAFLKMLEG